MEKVSSQRVKAYKDARGLTRARKADLGIFLGDCNPFNEYVFSGLDHASIFLKDGMPDTFVIQPYVQSHRQEDLDAWSQFCQQYHLRYTILPSDSDWHNPGRTMCVEFTYDQEYAGPPSLGYKKIVKRRGARLRAALKKKDPVSVNWIDCGHTQSKP